MKALERALDWDRHLEATALAAMAVGLALATLLLVLVPWVDPHLGGRLPERALWLGLLMAAGGSVYFAAAIGLGAFRPAELAAQFRRRHSSP